MPSRPVSQKITRRRWTQAFIALAGTVPLAAQVTSKTPPEGSPAPAQPAATPEQKLQKAYADVHQVSERLSQIEVPMNVEPAFAFRA